MQNINFKGYDALPLKSVYLEELYCEPFIDEMQAIAAKEGFEIKTALDANRWIQDDKTIIEKDKKPYLVANDNVSDNFLSELKEKGIEGELCSKGFLIGGDTFIGKYPNGKKWILTGEKIGITHGKSEIADTYGVDKESIFQIPKQNYHLDTFIRPIGYPYVLVNDFQLVDKNIEMLNDNSKEYRTYWQTYLRFKHILDKQDYDNADRVCASLEMLGFVPIRIAGVYGSEINFMNAIVNKHEDGTISYITHSSETESIGYYKKIQDTFQKDLNEKVPNLSKTYFVKGKQQDCREKLNYMMLNFLHRGGGLHCMSLEEPNFEAWA